jgi:solute carrier family 25 uncoupling protein 8/9
MAPAAPAAAQVGPVASFGLAATAACTAEIATLPLDTAKVRLQIQKAGADGSLKYNGLLNTAKTIAAEEGVAALWKGLIPGLHRQVLFGGLRIGLYTPVKQLYDPLGLPALANKIAAGITTGFLAISVANPTDLVKVRLQAQGREGGAPKYSSALGAYAKIAKEEGIAGLWTGYGANVGRNSIINAVELAGYDVVKENLIGFGMPEDVRLHISSGLGAGFLAVCIGSPFDVVKSRLMGAAEGEFSGIIDCFAQTFKKEGPAALYKGFIPNFARLGGWNTCMFVTLEQLRAFYLQRQG